MMRLDPTFGTGIAKVTPAHDMMDFEIAKRHNLPMKQVIGFDGRLTESLRSVCRTESKSRTGKSCRGYESTRNDGSY